MLYSYNWLREYVEGLPGVRELSERLTMTGTEVEGVEERTSAIKGVKTAEILSIEPHPNADRLVLCQVRTDRETHSIVCGARNMKVGDRVALALPGSLLPGGVTIKKARIRGVESQGMMASEVELGIAEASDGIMILPVATPLGVDINEVLSLGDYLLEVGVTPNRADLLSTRGLARELSAITGKAFRDKKVTLSEAGRRTEGIIKVSIDSGVPCRRYTARVIEGVKIAPSPPFIAERLLQLGIRSVNNVVDITNYVMLEVGQPLHAFDLDRIKDRTIRVRLAEEGEAIETIDGKARTLRDGMLVIADSAHPVAVAGVMGGKGSEVGDGTVNILLESAWFEPSSVRWTSRRLGLSSDSSYRFERGVDIEAVPFALDMAASLIARLAGGSVASGVVDVYPARLEPRSIRFRVKRASALIGVALEGEKVCSHFNRLGVKVDLVAPGELSATPPSFRMDLKEEIDLVEEAARLLGYENIPATLPSAAVLPGEAARTSRLRKAVSGVLVADGFYEVMNYSFISREVFGLTGPPEKRGVEVRNPLSEEQVVLRDSLLPTLLENLRYNVLRKNEEVRIFEIAPVFSTSKSPIQMANEIPQKGDVLPEERWKVAGLMWGPRWPLLWNLPPEPLDFFDVKGVVEKVLLSIGISAFETRAPEGHERNFLHPGKSARLYLDGVFAGLFGEIHPGLKTRYELKKAAYVFELDIGALSERAFPTPGYRAVPRYPESARDVAFIVSSDIPFGEILKAVCVLDTKLIEKVDLFDVYYGGNIPGGKRSLAIRITYRSAERTLRQEEVEALHERVRSELTTRFGAVIRGEAVT